MAPVNVECPIEDCDYTATHAEAAVMSACCVRTPLYMSQSPRALCANVNWGTQESDRSTCRAGRALVILHNPLECCDDELRKDLTRAAGKGLINSAENRRPRRHEGTDLRSENTMVARVTLSNMRQGHEGPIRSFYARIKDTCKYEMTCTKAECDQVNDFTEEILRNVIAHGTADQ